MKCIGQPLAFDPGPTSTREEKQRANAKARDFVKKIKRLNRPAANTYAERNQQDAETVVALAFLLIDEKKKAVSEKASVGAKTTKSNTLTGQLRPLDARNLTELRALAKANEKAKTLYEANTGDKLARAFYTLNAQEKKK